MFAFSTYAFWSRAGDSMYVAPNDKQTIVSRLFSGSVPSTTDINNTSTATTPTPTPVHNNPTPAPTPTPVSSGQYKNGEYTGSVADAYYGYVQVKAIISGGKITDVQFLSYPNDRNTSRSINSQAMPILKSEAIRAQSAKVNIVSGATDTSLAFRQSLASALVKAVV